MYIYIYILKTSFLKLEHKGTSKTLSEHVWKLKNKNINFNIQWEIVKKVKPFAPNNKVCKFCLQEKLSTLRSAPSLNKRSEFFGHCLAILTSQRQPMRSPYRPKLRVLTKDLSAKYYSSLYL